MSIRRQGNSMTVSQSFYETPSPPGLKGIWAWLLTHDHKRLGLMYFWAILFWLSLALIIGLAVTVERFMTFNKAKLNVNKFLEELGGYIRKGDFSGAGRYYRGGVSLSYQKNRDL